LGIPDYFREEARRLGVRARYGRRRVHRAATTTSPFGLFLTFLKIGTVGFGGGLAVIAQVRALVVTKRKWLTDREFAEGFALAQSLPGTNAGNAVAYIGLLLHGWVGALASICGFVLPSYLIMVALAVGYDYVRSLPDTDRLFHGLNSAVVALILVTAWRIGSRALTRRWQWWVAATALAFSLAGATTLEIVVGAGLVGIYVARYGERRVRRARRLNRLALRRRQRLAELEQRGLAGTWAMAHHTRGGAQLRALALVAALVPLMHYLGLLVRLATVFIRVGAVTFGGGFVMIPLIEQSVVEANHWLSPQEFADATALGQITPGPVLITATFIGYRVAGVVGSLVATVAVFAPAFAMTIAAGSSLRRFQANELVQAFLRGVTPAVVGLLAAAAWGIGRAGIHSPVGVAIAVACTAVLLRFNLNAALVIFGAGAARYLASLWLGY
jgi:chromate transporter